MRISQNNLESENEILKRLLKDSYILINYDSRDCDGCSTSKVLMHKDGSLDLNENYNGGQWSN